MKILFLPNWKVEKCIAAPSHKQPPDYYVEGEPYWFFKFFSEQVNVDIIDISSLSFIEKFEKNKLRFYVIQTLKAFPKLKNYDLIISHGMQSGIILSLLRRIFDKNIPPHVVFEIGSFNSASELGIAMKFMQFASKSLDGIIYHTNMQIEYYKKFYPWLVNKSKFIPFGTDKVLFDNSNIENTIDRETYILCVGYSKRDWKTLFKAYERLNSNIKLRLVGKNDIRVKNDNIEIIPFIPINELIGQIHNALFCILPLEYYNYSFGQMTLLQQMALGKAVITARVPSMIDYVEDEYDILLYKPNDIEDLKDKMEMLIMNKQLRRKLGEHAIESVKFKFNENNMAESVEKFIMRIINEKKESSK